MKQIFETKATATGGRNGQVNTEDGLLSLEVRMPKSLGGSGGEFTNPEQLFACGYAACFDSALNHVARLERKKIDSKTSATIGLKMHEDKSLSLTAKIEVEVKNLDKETVQDLVEKAHKVCPYSRATQNNIEVEIKVI